MPIINYNGFPLDPFGFSLEAIFRKMVFRWNFFLTKWFFVRKKLFFVGSARFFVGKLSGQNGFLLEKSCFSLEKSGFSLETASEFQRNTTFQLLTSNEIQCTR